MFDGLINWASFVVKCAKEMNETLMKNVPFAHDVR
jgi:hypothetical protein